MARVKLTKELLINEARNFCVEMSRIKHDEIRGVTDGKSVGDYFEKIFKKRISQKYETKISSSAKGIDLLDPEINTDIKVTSIAQPQSSAPFRSFRQKIYGLGYNVLLFVYRKNDRKEFNIQFIHARFIDSERTGDYITTKGLQGILKEGGNIDDIKAFIVERIPYIDDIELERLAKEVLKNPPKLGYLTISQALQWRLQYSRILQGEFDGVIRIYG